MKGSGSSLPLSVRNGLTIGAENPDDNAAAGILAYGPRRAKMDDDPFGGETIGDTSTPQEPGTPVGDGTWVMLVMAMGFAGVTPPSSGRRSDPALREYPRRRFQRGSHLLLHPVPHL